MIKACTSPIDVSVIDDTLYDNTISLNLSLTKLTLYLWTMLKSSVTVLSDAAAVKKRLLFARF